MQRFKVDKRDDETGGMKKIAEGIKFADGSVVVQYAEAEGLAGMAIYQDIAAVTKMNAGATISMIDAE
jgi:hypothetical protein